MLDATPLFRLYAKRRLARIDRLDPVATQERVLRRLLRRAATTRFGRAHDFSLLRTVADYQRAVPLRRYDDFWRDWWQPSFPRLTDVTWPGTIPYFALSSGTSTGITKYIPLSHAMMRSNQRAGADLLAHFMRDRPDSKLFAGRSFMLGGSTDVVQEAPGIFSGDLSGIAVKEMPRWAQSRAFPPADLALIADWEEKVEKLAPAALEADLRLIGGTPSWLLIFFDRLAALRPESAGRLAALFPDLELLIHGGVSFAPYRQRFDALLAGSRAERREVYPASEGFIAFADRPGAEGLRLTLDIGLFYEFVPLAELDRPNPTRHWLATVEAGIDYAIVLTTCAGLWAYVIGDTVRFVETAPPRLIVTGRTSYMLSAFGEHVIDLEVEQAVAAAALAIGAAVTDFSVGAVFPTVAGDVGGHLYVVEFAGGVPDDVSSARFTAEVDRSLQAANADYRAHRSDGFGLRAPELLAMPPGGFAAWMKQRGKLGGQNKVPRIVTSDALFADLRAFAAVQRGG